MLENSVRLAAIVLALLPSCSSWVQVELWRGRKLSIYRPLLSKGIYRQQAKLFTAHATRIKHSIVQLRTAFHGTEDPRHKVPSLLVGISPETGSQERYQQARMGLCNGIFCIILSYSAAAHI